MSHRKKKNVELVKVSIQVIDYTTEKTHWVALCEVSKSLFNQFAYVFNMDYNNIADFLRDWARYDFNANLTLVTLRSVKLLRKFVIDRYRRLYPEIYYSDVSAQNWLRVWVNEHMIHTLKKHGEIVQYE